MDPRLQDMLDHHEIRKTLAEYCHVCDRADAAGMAAVYTGDDSWDDHATVKAPGPEYARVMTRIIIDRTEAIWHSLGQSIVTVDADTAGAETFFLALLRMPEQAGMRHLNLLAGRFVDRLARVAGRWRIKHRICVRDTSITLPVTRDDYEDFGFVEGRRDAEDVGAALLRFAHHVAAA